MLPSAVFSVLLCVALTTANAIICPTLKSAANFTVVAGSEVTNSGPTVINGNVAISSGSSLTGFNPTGVITGKTELATAVAAQAQQDVSSVYNQLMGATFIVDMTGVDLMGKILRPGVYKFSSTAAITAGSVLTFSGSGVYVFQVGSSIVTGANTKMLLKNGATANCVFWQVGSSAALGADSQFVGNILAYSSVTFGSNVTYIGSVYAHTAAVTFIADTITGQGNCDQCYTISQTIENRASGYMYENIVIFIPGILLLSFFSK